MLKNNLHLRLVLNTVEVKVVTWISAVIRVAFARVEPLWLAESGTSFVLWSQIVVFLHKFVLVGVRLIHQPALLASLKPITAIVATKHFFGGNAV